MPRLTIRIKKKSDGSSALSCIREDGSTTWQVNEGATGAFFPFHDLTHYAVETVMGHCLGFYGLVASGWDFSDFGFPWPKGPFPANADWSELFVSVFDSERAMGIEWSEAEFREQIVSAIEGLGFPGAGAAGPDESTLRRIRADRAALFARWEALSPGDTLELLFDPESFGAA